MAGAELDGAAPAGVDLADLGGRGDDLATAGKVGPGHQRQHRVEVGLGVAHQRDRRGRDLAQVVRRDLGRHADRDARGAVEQHHRQPRGQQRRLLGRAVVVRHELDRPLVDLVEQQPRVGREAGLGIAHRGRAVAVARAEVALPVDQRIAQRERLRHANQRVVRRGVAVRMEAAEHVADHARRLHGLGGGTQPHLVHCIKDAALHRLLAVADVGQCTPLDHRDRVVEVGALGIARERQRTVVLGRRWRGRFGKERRLIVHGLGCVVVVGGRSGVLRRRPRPRCRAPRASRGARRPRPCPSAW
jgi:hypothetical protein